MKEVLRPFKLGVIIHEINLTGIYYKKFITENRIDNPSAYQVENIYSNIGIVQSNKKYEFIVDYDLTQNMFDLVL